MVGALQRLAPPATLRDLVPAVAADVDEGPQRPLTVTRHDDRDVSRAAGEELAGLGHVLRHAGVLPGAPEDALLLEPEHGRIRVPRRRQREAALELRAEIGGEVDGHRRRVTRARDALRPFSRAGDSQLPARVHRTA